MLDAFFRDGCCHLWIGGGIRFLVHNVWLTAIAAGCSRVLLQILCRPGKLVRGSRFKDKDVTFQVTIPTLEVGIGLGICTLVFDPGLITSVLVVLG